MTAGGPIIGWRNLFRTHPSNHAGARDNGTWRNALTHTTFDVWTLEGQQGQSGGDSIQVTTSGLGASRPPCFVGIANHNLASAGYRWRFRYWDENATPPQWSNVTGSPFTPPATTSTEGDRDETTGAILDMAPADNRWEFVLEGGGTSADAFIGNLSMGPCLCVPTPAWSSAPPIRWAYDIDARPQVSASGHYMGRTVRRRGKRASVTFNNLPASWVRETETRRFIEYALTKPFFIWPRPTDYPLEVEYVWATRPITISNTGPGPLVSMSMELQAYAAPAPATRG